MKVEEKLKEMGIELPAAPSPAANYVTTVRAGNLVFLSGHPPIKTDGTKIIGRVGEDLDLDEGYQAARRVAIALTASLRKEVGDLDKVKRIVKLLG